MDLAPQNRRGRKDGRRMPQAGEISPGRMSAGQKTGACAAWPILVRAYANPCRTTPTLALASGRPPHNGAMKNSTTVLATVAALLGAALAGAGVVVYSGVYDVSATSQHLQPVYSLLETTMHRSV